MITILYIYIYIYCQPLHLQPMHVENRDSNSRFLVDKDDNSYSVLKGLKCYDIRFCPRPFYVVDCLAVLSSPMSSAHMEILSHPYMFIRLSYEVAGTWSVVMGSLQRLITGTSRTKNTGFSPVTGSMLGHRLRWWPSIEPVPGERFVFA